MGQGPATSQAFAAWRARLLSLAQSQASRDGPPQPLYARKLADFYWLMREAPKAAGEAYRRIDELALDALVRPRVSEIAGRAAPPWSPVADAELDELVLSLAVEARAVDEALREVRDKARPADPDVEWAVESDQETLVVPRFRDPPAPSAAATGRTYMRRGLRFHRVIPREIGGCRVRLYAPPLVGPGLRGEACDLGAALFEDVRLELDPTQEGRGFRVVGIANEDELRGALPGQVREAHQRPYLAAMWPELCVSPAMREDLIGEFGAQAFEEHAAGPPGLVIAGSWHDPHGEGVANVMRITDAQGRLLISFRKLSAFWLKEKQGDPGRFEDIVTGDELPVLVYGDLLIAFGICKDFCDLGDTPPYVEMAVDLMLVPSFGDEKTLNGHLQNAKAMRVRHDARVFVVQQRHPKAPDGGGYVVPAPDDPDGLKAPQCEQAEPWKPYPLPRR